MEEESPPIVPAGESWIPRFLRPPVAGAPITDPAEIASKYAVLRPRVLLWTTFGYAMFYFVRKNLSVAMPGEDNGAPSYPG